MTTRTSTLLALPLLLGFTGVANALVIFSAEDDGSINLANFAGFGSSFNLQGTIGDGPYGGTTGDYDFFRFENILAGSLFSAATFSGFDPVIGIYNPTGQLLATNDDASGAGGSSNNLDSFISNFVIPTTGNYSLVIRGFGASFQSDPFNSASGGGVGSRGNYTATVTINPGTQGIPEPASLVLLGIGLVGMGVVRRRRG